MCHSSIVYSFCCLSSFHSHFLSCTFSLRSLYFGLLDNGFPGSSVLATNLSISSSFACPGGFVSSFGYRLSPQFWDPVGFWPACPRQDKCGFASEELDMCFGSAKPINFMSNWQCNYFWQEYSLTPTCSRNFAVWWFHLRIVTIVFHFPHIDWYIRSDPIFVFHFCRWNSHFQSFF